MKFTEVQWNVWHDGVDPAVGVTQATCIVTPDHHRAKSFKTSNLGLVPIAYGSEAADVTYRASVRRHGDSGFLPGNSATAPQ